MHGSRVSFSLAPSRRRSSVSLPSLRPLRYEALALTELALEEAGEDAAAGLRELADEAPTITVEELRRRRSSAAVVRAPSLGGRRRSSVRRSSTHPGRSNAEIAQSMQALIQSKAELANIQQRVDSMLKTYEQGEVDEAIATVTEREDDFLPEEFPVVEDALQEGDAAAALQHLLGTLKRRAAETVDELSSQNEQQLHGLSLVLGWFGDSTRWSRRREARVEMYTGFRWEARSGRRQPSRRSAGPNALQVRLACAQQ